MKCIDVRKFLAEVAGTSISTRIEEDDLSLLASNYHIARISREEHERAAAELANLDQMVAELQQEREDDAMDEEHLERDKAHLQGIRFHFEGRERQEAARADVEKEEQHIAEQRAAIAQKDDKVLELIRKKSALDVQVQYGNEYLVLTEPGMRMLHDLSIRNYRVADTEFSDFMDECRATSDALRGIAQRARYYADMIRPSLASREKDEDEEEMRRIRERGLESQLWAVSIGLAKLEIDKVDDLIDRYVRTLDLIDASDRFRSNLDSRVIATEIIALSNMLPGVEQIQSLAELDEELRHANVPEGISIRVAATILCGGGSPERFEELAKMTESHQAAAMLSTINIPSDELRDRFKSLKILFDSWGYSESEDSDLAAAYLSITKSTADDIGHDPSTKMITILNGIKNDLEYPLLPAAILTSIAALNADEVLDLVEKGAAILQPAATDLERSELTSLAVRMVYGRQEVGYLGKTPIQFTWPRLPPQEEKDRIKREAEEEQGRGTRFFFRGGYYGGWYYYYYPVIITHSSYHSTYHGMGRPHPGHWHGVGGFAG